MGSAVADKINELSERLGLSRQDVARIVGSSARQVSRWSAGERAPQRSNLQTLLELSFIGDQLRTLMHPEQAQLWLLAPNALLGGDSPAERIRDGDYRTVLALIEALADGVVT